MIRGDAWHHFFPGGQIQIVIKFLAAWRASGGLLLGDLRVRNAESPSGCKDFRDGDIGVGRGNRVGRLGARADLTMPL